MTMRHAAVSNIAWSADNDEEALDLAAELGFSGIEIAPAKVFGPLDAVDLGFVRTYRDKLAARGLVVPAMQAILFGIADSHLFAGAEKRARLAYRFDQVAALAEALGARSCVFGAPGLRDPGDLATADAWCIAVEFFAEVAPRFAERGATLCFEANPALYNCRFVTHTDEAMRLVRDVGCDGFGLQLDMGTVFINGEGADIAEAAARMASHAHVSEPGLVPIGTAGVDHGLVATALVRAAYAHWLSVEMRGVDDWRAAMRRAVGVMREAYGMAPVAPNTSRATTRPG